MTSILMKAMDIETIVITIVDVAMERTSMTIIRIVTVAASIVGIIGVNLVTLTSI